MDITCRTDFLKLAGLVEGGLLLLALLAAHWTGIDVWSHLRVTWPAVALGLLGTLPVFAVYAMARDTRSVAVEMMGQPLSQCRWYDLFVLAALAGVGEELMFRGVLQPWLSGSSALFGLLAANVLFGLVHLVTPSYALIAAGIGLYLSGITYAVPHANLLSAMIAHGVYDYVAFLLIIHEYRAGKSSAPIDDLAVDLPNSDQAG